MDIKSILISIVAIIGLGIASCDRSQGMNLSDCDNPTGADSLLFYIVQLRAHEYWKNSEQDTSLRNPEVRERFLKGYEKGYNSIKRDDEYYNRGVELGVRMAINIQKFEKMYEVKIDNSLALPFFQYGLRDGADIPEFQYQEAYYKLVDRFKLAQRRRDHEKAQRTLVEVAREKGMMKLSDNLYFRMIKTGTGPYVQYGQSAHVMVNYERADGQDIAIPAPGLVTVGSLGVPDVLNEAYTRLNKGSVGLFATTAEALFGSRTYVMGMKPEDVLLVIITLNDIVSPNSLSLDSI